MAIPIIESVMINIMIMRIEFDNSRIIIGNEKILFPFKNKQKQVTKGF